MIRFQKSMIAVIFLSAAVFIHAQNSISKIIQEFSNTKLLKHAQWSLLAKYVDTGEVIFSHNPDFSLAPASCLKLITTAAALDGLGEQGRFATELYYQGTVDKTGTLKGNLIIKGGGDATLGSDRVEGSKNLNDLMEEWNAALDAVGIKEIDGSIIADDRLFDNIHIPGSWNWIDIGNYYGSSASALCINDNLYYLYFKPGVSEDDPAELLRIEPQIPGLSFENYMKTGAVGSGDNGYVYNAPGSFNAVLRGTVPAGYKEFDIKGSIPDPPLFAAQYFRKYLIGSGKTVSGGAITSSDKIDYSTAKLFWRNSSPSVKDIVYIINKKSFNLYAEQLLRMLGVDKYGEGSISSGIDAVNDYLEKLGINTDGMQLYDGSGLSRSNMITAEIMVDLLIRLTNESYFPAFFESLGITGKRDDPSSFRNWGIETAIENNAHVKSGSIEGVKSHSGYVSDSRNRLIAFSFIANNFSGKSSDISLIHKKIMIELAGK